MPDETRELKTILSIDAEKASQDVVKYQQRIDILKRSLIDLVNQGKSFGAAQATIKDQLNQTKRAALESAEALGGHARKLQELKAEEAAKGLQVLGTSATQAKKDMGLLGEETSKTARIMERIFAAAIIGVVLNALRSFINYIQDAIASSNDFRMALVDLKVSAENFDVGSFEDWNKFVDEASEKFTQFTKKDLNAGVADLLDLARVAGLSADEVKSLINDLAILATKERSSFTEAEQAFATAAGSFRGTSLRKYIEASDEVSLAQEAINRGLIENEDQMNRNIAATVAMMLVNERANDVAETTSAIQKDISGQYVETSQNAIDAADAIGGELLPATTQLKKLWESILVGVAPLLSGLLDIFIALGATFVGVFGTMAEAVLHLDDIVSGNFDIAETLVKNYNIAFGILQDNLKLSAIDDFSLGNVNKEFEEGKSVVDDYADNLESVFIKLREVIIGVNEDIAKENRKNLDDILEDERKFALKMEQFAEKYQFDIDKINRDYNQKRADANEDYREKEIKAEEDFQEKLRKLREQFLLDLEDALRERDARQILRLIREFNLRKTQLERERKQEQDDNKRKLADQLNDIEKQRQARLAERKLEYDFQLQQQLEQQALEKELRQKDHEDRLREIRIQGQERAREIARRYADEHDITASFALGIRNLLNREFGPGGYVDGIYNYFIGLIGNMATATAQANGYVNQLRLPVGVGLGGTIGTGGDGGAGGSTDDYYDRYKARGNQIMQQNVQEASLGSAPLLAQANPLSTQSRVLIEMLLSPDLEGRIIDQSLNTVADVIFRKTR